MTSLPGGRVGAGLAVRMPGAFIPCLSRFAMPRNLTILLTLMLVGGPLSWLLFSQEGQRRTDLALLPLLGRATVELSLNELSSRLGEADIRAKLGDLDLECSDQSTTFGDRTCRARIGAFARLPAESLTFFLSGGGLRAAKINYRRDVHGEVAGYLTRHLGEGETSKRGPDGAPSLVTNWQLMDGLVLLHAGDLAPRDEAAMLWLSAVAVTERARANRGPKSSDQ